jgi:hypothetical protein
MKTQNWLWVSIGLTVLALILIGALIGIACNASSKPVVVLNAPVTGSQFNEGQAIVVQSTATDSKGIVKVVLSVDNLVIQEDKIDPPQKSIALPFKWTATAGQHTVTARAINADNVTSDPDTLVIVASAAPGPAPTVAPTLAPTAVPTVVVPTPGPGPCSNNAAFIADVTVPDGTSFQPNQQFNKIWRVQNVGSCTWNPKYQLVFTGGEQMTNLTQVAVPSNIAPGQTVDLLIAMTAPAIGGTHTGQWQLHGEEGARFGPVLTVKINTIVPVPPPQAAITSPGAGFQFAAGTVIRITFQGVGNTELSSVSLYINNTLVSKATSRTPSRIITGVYDWQPGVGNYTLYAVATDIQGQSTTSGKISGTIIQPQPQCQLYVNFRADAYTINVGQRTTLRWDVECANAVYLDGQGVTGHEARDVQPNATTTYTLRVIKKDNTPDERRITITVNPAPQPTPVPIRRNINGTWRAGDYSVELMEAIGCPGVECGISGRLIHQVGTTTPQIVDVHGSFNTSSGAVSFTTVLLGGQSFSGTVSADSRTMSGTLSGVGALTFTKQ